MPQESAPELRLKLSDFRKIKKEFGINARESMQKVSFGNYKDRMVAEMLSETPNATGEICPVPQAMREKYREEGRAGVEKSFMGFSMIYGGFENPIIKAAEQRAQRVEQRNQQIAESIQKKNKFRTVRG